jgi:hypothetical protein
MMKMSKPIFAIVPTLLTAILILSLPVSAQTNIPQESPTFNRSVRALGMGNAFIASDGSSYSPFYNPAGLNDIEKWELKFLSSTLDMSYGGIGLITDALDLKKDLSNAQTTPDKVRALDTFVAKNAGDFQYFRSTFDIASYTRKNFAIGMLIDERMTFSFRDQSFTNFEARNIGDATVYIAGSYGLWEKLLQFGVTLRPTVRFAMNDTITYDTVIGTTQADWETRLKSTYKDYKFGLPVDIGFKSNLNFPGLRDIEKFKAFQKSMRPTLALTWQDIANPFPKTKTTDAGQIIGFVENKQSVNLGFAIHPALGFLSNTFEVDFLRLNQAGSFMTKFYVGGEFRFPKILALRGGFGQGKPSAGITLDFKILKLEAATYAEETGIYGIRMGDRRVAASISFQI